MNERMSTPTPDEHLRQALRHAPDADVSAPAYLRAQIVAAAHRSTAQPAAAKPASRWGARMVPRWGASGALATVALAGFIGLMWRGETPAPMADKPAPVVAQAPARARASAPALALAPAPAPATSGAPDIKRRPATATEVRADKVATLNKAESAPAPRLQNAPPQVADSADSAESADLARLAGATQAAQASRKEALEVPRPAPALASAERAADASAATAAGPAPALRQRMPAAPAIPTAAPWPWRETLQEGDQVQWWPAWESRPVAVAGLQQLMQATRGRWQPVQDAPAGQDVQQLRWLRGDITLGRFWFEPDTVLWCGAAPPCQRAALDGPALRALLSALGR